MNQVQPVFIQPSPLPDETHLSGNTPDGKTVSLTAGALRNEHHDPRLRYVKLFIGLPIYSQATTPFWQCLMQLQAQKPCSIEIHVGQGDGVGRTRNVLTAKFLKTDCTHLLFMDSDLIFTIQHVKELLLCDKPVVGGFYPKKQQGKLEWVVNALQPSPEPANHLQPLKYIGTGFLCVKREVFEKMIESYPEMSFREDYGERGIGHDFWSMGTYRNAGGEAVLAAAKLLRYLSLLPGAEENAGSELNASLKAIVENIPNSDEGRYLSEDWFFCQRWLDMGGEVFGHTRVALRHLGPVIFPLDTQMPEVANPKP